MASHLQQLENNQAILLMYLADELEAEDREEVEQLLTSDAGLRAELEQLRQSQQEVLSALDELDQGDASIWRQEAAVRQIGRLIRQWQVQNRPPVVVKTQRKSLAYPWWSYPTAAAAAVLLAFLAWWGNQAGGPVNLGDNAAYTQSDGNPMSFGMRGTALFDPTGHSEAMEPLNDAENQLAALYASSEPGANAWIMDPSNQ